LTGAPLYDDDDVHGIEVCGVKRQCLVFYYFFPGGEKLMLIFLALSKFNRSLSNSVKINARSPYLKFWQTLLTCFDWSITIDYWRQL